MYGGGEPRGNRSLVLFRRFALENMSSGPKLVRTKCHYALGLAAVVLVWSPMCIVGFVCCVLF